MSFTRDGVNVSQESESLMGYTSPECLAIGGSQSGEILGAASNFRKDRNQ